MTTDRLRDRLSLTSSQNNIRSTVPTYWTKTLEMHQNKHSNSRIDCPILDELAALTADCFPRIDDAIATITEYSETSCHVQRYHLEEVLSSRFLLGPPTEFIKVRWIHVDYHKLGTFWGSSFRFLQWGTDPVLFEQSPIILMQQRSAELDREARRDPLESEELQGLLSS